MKESPGNPPLHLKNAIDYILDIKNDGYKTEYGKWVGGNSGLDHDEIFQNFMETKQYWEKEEGRQGYHFVISFPPGEVDAAKCYEVVQEFCKEYLGDNYDYVFAVHTDQPHLHGHIIFNSLNRVNGYKYHYKNGDWKRDIQPITDKLCKKHGLMPLIIEEGETVGVSHAAWAAEKKGTINWTHIIRADVDYAIEKAKDMSDFASIMQKMNYSMRFGHSWKKNKNYITFCYHAEEGKLHKKKSFSLGPEYTVEDIVRRIREKDIEPYHKQLTEQLTQKGIGELQRSAVFKSTMTYKRMYQAVSYYNLPNPFAVPSYRVRKDMIRLEKLMEECAYIRTHSLKSYDAIEKKDDELDARLKQLYMRRKGFYEIKEIYEKSIEPELLKHFLRLEKEMLSAREEDDIGDRIQEELEELSTHIPYEIRENERKLLRCEVQINMLKQEKRVVSRVKNNERGKDCLLHKEIKAPVTAIKK